MSEAPLAAAIECPTCGQSPEGYLCPREGLGIAAPAPLVDFTRYPEAVLAVGCPNCGARRGLACKSLKSGCHAERRVECDRVWRAQGCQTGGQRAAMPTDAGSAVRAAATKSKESPFSQSPSGGVETRQRPSDMDPGMALRLMRQEDGDLILSIGPVGDRFHPEAVEFCTSVGGGRSPKTLAALRQLWKAMEEDDAR